jgi:hypothetical protein
LAKGNFKDEVFGEPISIYTSAQAEEDGYLVKTGDKDINYMTSAVYQKMVEEKLPDLETVEKMNGLDRALYEARRYALFRGVVIGAKLEVMKIQKEKGTDWFYKVKVNGTDFFVVLNETSAYTLMFPEDY